MDHGAARILAAAALAVLAGCTASAGSPSSSAAAPSDTNPSASSTDASRRTDADPATTAAVARAYATFFSDKSTTPQSQAALQHGQVFTATLQQQSNSPHAQQSSAAVSQVLLESADVADVKFSITSNHVRVLSDVSGHAVREDGTWKVAAATFCQLLTLQGDAPKACNDASVTALSS
ncbi:MAG: hypothetical protein ACRDVG_14290 [Jatrophihabitantaceae bacterium]